MFCIPLIVFLEQSALSTHPTAWYESRKIAFVHALHFGTTFWMRAFWVFDVWHNKCIQLSKG
jgi:hypothetical protein